ncbi:MAG: hypothetical protein OXF67_05655 [Cyanobacteria bacterium MAG CAR4_bin_6]|nr:hypothetical protein [Cyanobacteria bacterium MAG CAR4_bin_6]
MGAVIRWFGLVVPAGLLTVAGLLAIWTSGLGTDERSVFASPRPAQAPSVTAQDWTTAPAV